MSDIKCYDSSNEPLTALFQWDLNQTISVHGVDMPPIPLFHFCNRKSDVALVVTPTASSGVLTVAIPNILLQEAETITAYLYESTTNDGYRTIYAIDIPVVPRTKPSDYIFEENISGETVSSLTVRVDAVEISVASLASAVFGATNNDPNALTTRVATLETTTSGLSVTVNTLSGTVGGLSTTVDGLSTTVGNHTTAITNMQNTQIKTWRQSSTPTAADNKTGDLWFKTSDSKWYRWSGSAWEKCEDGAISTLSTASTDHENRISTLENTVANLPSGGGGSGSGGGGTSNVDTFYQATVPSAGVTTGDLWYNSSTSAVSGYAAKKLFRYNGSTWEAITDGDIATASTLAGSKTRIYYRTTPPTSSNGLSTNDLWFNTSTSAGTYEALKFYRYTGSAWEKIEDGSIATLTTSVSDLGTRMTAAEGTISSHTTSISNLTTTVGQKTRVFYQTSAPSSGRQTGDLWFNTSTTSGTYVALKWYRFNGSSWVKFEDGGIAQLDSRMTVLEKYAWNENLLDNWYFPTVVDQRAGYLIPPNTAYYKPATSSDVYGYTSKHFTVTSKNSSKAYFTNSGSCAAAASSAVRGYISASAAGYGFDRWYMTDGGIMKLGSNNGLILGNSKTSAVNCFQVMGRVRTSPDISPMTISVLTTGGVLYTASGTSPSLSVPAPGSAATDAALTLTLTTKSSKKALQIAIPAQTTSGTDTASVEIAAIKVEYGTQQTLAHQESNTWVLNGPYPDYIQELNKCQMYYMKYDTITLTTSNFTQTGVGGGSGSLMSSGTGASVNAENIGTPEYYVEYKYLIAVPATMYFSSTVQAKASAISDSASLTSSSSVRGNYIVLVTSIQTSIAPIVTYHTATFTNLEISAEPS